MSSIQERTIAEEVNKVDAKPISEGVSNTENIVATEKPSTRLGGEKQSPDTSKPGLLKDEDKPASQTDN